MLEKINRFKVYFRSVLMKDRKMVITKDGLFYSNYDKSKFTAFGVLDELLAPDRNVLFALCPYLFPRSILYIREKYGLKISEPQLYGSGIISDNAVGLY